MTKWELYLEHKRELDKVLEWMALVTGPKYMTGDAFNISTAHCSLKLVRMGQQRCSGQAYWDSPTLLNSELLSLIAEDPVLIARAIDRIKSKNRQMLLDAESKVQAQLTEIKNAQDMFGYPKMSEEDVRKEKECT